jgi:hypothetical protein
MILGMYVTVTHDHEVGWITLSQQKYVTEILERFGMSNAWPISAPALANEHLVKHCSPEIDTKYYQRAIGALMYPMLGTRPDLAYTIAALGRHAANPGTDHQCALDRALRYLRATSDYKLTFRRGITGGTHS